MKIAPPGLVFRAVHFAVPKDPSYPGEIEDAVAFDETAGVAVVVDGASTGFDPVEWSRTLARVALETTSTSNGLDLRLVARNARKVWGSRPAPKLPPGIREKATGATIGIIRVLDGVHPSLEGQFVGDVNVLVLRAGTTPHLPNDLALGSQYTASPETINTEPRSTMEIRKLSPVSVVSGDVVLLFTDGFGKWLVDRAGCRQLMEHLVAMDAHSFINLVRAEQAANRMEVDDVMLLRCTVQ